MKRGSPSAIFLFSACTLVLLFSLHPPAIAIASPDEDVQTLDMFFDQKEIAEVATRAPQDVSLVAENITIVTAREIEALNAHTLADVLRIIPGLQEDIQGGPGSLAFASINGASVQQFLVVIDGVQLNNLSDNVVNIGSIPVQNVNRIEIIKGPASSSWGPALGGVINIVTKEPFEGTELGGTLASSLGGEGERRLPWRAFRHPRQVRLLYLWRQAHFRRTSPPQRR